MQQQLITRQFPDEPLRHADPPTIRQHEVDGDAVIRFGPFSVLPRARQLLVGGRPIEVGSRAFDLLTVLISA